MEPHLDACPPAGAKRANASLTDTFERLRASAGATAVGAATTDGARCWIASGPRCGFEWSSTRVLARTMGGLGGAEADADAGVEAGADAVAEAGVDVVVVATACGCGFSHVVSPVLWCPRGR